MHFLISSKDFFSIVSKLQGVIDRKNTIPLLSNLLIHAEDGAVTVTGTDLSIGVRITHGAEVKQGGTITVSAKKLFEILKEIPSGTMSLEVDEKNWLFIKCQNAYFKLIGMNADNYPVLTHFDDKQLYSIDPKLIEKLVRKVGFAVSNEGSRLVFTGIQFSKVGTLLKMTATDGHRLAIIKQESDLQIPDFEVIIPKKTCHEILNHLEDSEGLLSMGWSDNKITFVLGNTQIISNLIEGKYPDMERAIPKIEDRTLSFNKLDMISAIRRVAVFSDNVSHGVRFDLAPDRIKISTSDPELGEAKEELEVSYEGEPLTVGFNSRYLSEALSVISSEDVTIKLKDASSSAFIQDLDEPHYICLIMPMRI